MVSAGRHPKSEVEAALARAEAAGLIVEYDKNGHRWGRVVCPECVTPYGRAKQTVWSTPRNPGNHAHQIDRFTASHTH